MGSYNPPCYREQGGAAFVASTGGAIKLDGGTLSTTGGGYAYDAIATASTAAASAAKNIIMVSSTNSTGVGAYNLAAPAKAGIACDIFCLTSTGGVTMTSTAATINLGSTVAGSVVTFAKAGNMVCLRSVSTTRWFGIPSSSNVTCT